MNLLIIDDDTPKTIKAKFSPDGKFSLSGVSLEEDPKIIYHQLGNWVLEYLQNPADLTELSIRLKYFNTSSAKYLLELIQTIVRIDQTDKKLLISWYYEKDDDDMLDNIKVFEELVEHEIKLVEVDSYDA